MSDTSQGHVWRQATDGTSYPPETHPNYRSTAVLVAEFWHSGQHFATLPDYTTEAGTEVMTQRDGTARFDHGRTLSGTCL